MSERVYKTSWPRGFWREPDPKKDIMVVPFSDAEKMRKQIVAAHAEKAIAPGMECVCIYCRYDPEGHTQ